VLRTAHKHITREIIPHSILTSNKTFKV